MMDSAAKRAEKFNMSVERLNLLEERANLRFEQALLQAKVRRLTVALEKIASAEPFIDLHEVAVEALKPHAELLSDEDRLP